MEAITASTPTAFSMEAFSPDVLWLIVVGFLVAFVLAFGIGANDVANSFGTSVGSKVLTVRQACMLATVFEIAGAVLIGYKVSDTMRKGILEVAVYEHSEKELMMGCLASLVGSATWLMVATFFKLPISGTHSIVGATVGFSLVSRGTEGLHWTTLGTIVGSWFISPVLSGLMSVVLFKLIRHFILLSPRPLVPGLRALPFFYGITIFVNVFSIVHDGPKLLYFDYIPWWGALIISVGVGLISMMLVQFVLVPYEKKRIVELFRKEKGRGVSFSFGDSTESSRDPSPKTSRAISTDDMKKTLPVITETCEQEKQVLALSDNNEMVQFPPVVSTNGTNKGANHTYCFPIPQTNIATTKSNGYLLAETTLNSSNNKDSASSIDAENLIMSMPGNGSVQPQKQQLLPDPLRPGSGQVTPVLGLSPNSSAVPLIKERVRDDKFDPEAAASKIEEVEKEDPPEVAKLFSFLQILTATFGSFAHGGNDVSNAIGPLIALWLIYKEGSVQQQSETPVYILLYGGLGISIGLWMWGRRVIQTIGEDLTKITSSTSLWSPGFVTMFKSIRPTWMSSPLRNSDLIQGGMVVMFHHATLQ
ncbi:sodium-dependent phosphate transporter 1-A isoform X2 [Zootermopsis nevadensis]|uniref:sodium-dependent phosphate transporter 1-A isoform X2 n=1 Tax=Zootermopsis nevadensis TaxID=136037 RepID=UPI000B8ED40D|nr:sodium-dependent phosphate transporter 1-A isoform X2 [Zootermopsis nevadensis]